MNLEEFKKSINDRVEELHFGIGFNDAKLREMNYSETDIMIIKTVKEVGEINIENDTLTATGLWARIANDELFTFEFSEPYDTLDSNIGEGSDFTFVQDEEGGVWNAFRSDTKYKMLSDRAEIESIKIKEFIPPTGRTSDIYELVNYVRSEDSALTDKKIALLLGNEYSFQSGARSDLGI